MNILTYPSDNLDISMYRLFVFKWDLSYKFVVTYFTQERPLLQHLQRMNLQYQSSSIKRYISDINFLNIYLKHISKKLLLKNSIYVSEKGSVFILNPEHLDTVLKEKINVNFYFHSSAWYLKSFTTVFMMFIKLFGVPHRIVKIESYVHFFQQNILKHPGR